VNSDRFVGMLTDCEPLEESRSPKPMIAQLEPSCEASMVTEVVPEMPVKL